MKTAADFWAFSQGSRKLTELHLNYESVDPYSLKIDSGGMTLTDADYRVEKMRCGKGMDKDLTTLHYNCRITLTGIPLEAYDYVVNGKPALDWVVERQSVKTGKDSDIVNDANGSGGRNHGQPLLPSEAGPARGYREFGNDEDRKGTAQSRAVGAAKCTKHPTAQSSSPLLNQ